MKKKTKNKQSIEYNVSNKKSNKIIYVLYERDDRKLYSYKKKNCKVILIKLLYNKSSLEKRENLLFNRKNHETKAEKYM